MKKKQLVKVFICMAAAVSVLTACQSKTQPGDTITAAEAGKEGDKENGSSESQGVFESFTAQDLDGNQVDQSIFSEADLTMINVWGTFCTPCLDEMPALGELSKEYKDKGVQIVGVCSDTVKPDKELDQKTIDKAKEIVSQTGADYLHIAMSGDLINSLRPQVMAVPMTIFVDSEGKQVGTAYMGARDKKSWAKIIDENLASLQ